jgi:DNA repair exonuclease SbcCD ATPase subunit
MTQKMSQQSSEINRLKSQFQDLLREYKKYQDPLAEHVRRFCDYSPQGWQYRMSLSSNHLRQFDEWERELSRVECEMEEVIRKLHELGSEIDGWNI